MGTLGGLSHPEWGEVISTLGTVRVEWTPEDPDDGKRHFPTGAVRDRREGKGRFDLLMPRAIAMLAKHLESGAGKYGDNNYRLGIPISAFMDSGLRHAFKYMAGHVEEDHLLAAAWNLMAAIEIRESIREGILPKWLEDMPPDLRPVSNQAPSGEPPEMRSMPDMGQGPGEEEAPV